MLQLGNWYEVKDGDPRVVALYERHYSANPATSHRQRMRSGVSGVGQSLILLTPEADACFIWLRNTIKRLDGQVGIQCSFFRNESLRLSSDLIKEADEMAWCEWSETRHWTYVNPSAIRSSNPGYCFIKAGWSRLTQTSKKGLAILEIHQ